MCLLHRETLGCSGCNEACLSLRVRHFLPLRLNLEGLGGSVTVALFDCLERFIRDDNAVDGFVDRGLLVPFLPPRNADTVKFAFRTYQLA